MNLSVKGALILAIAGSATILGAAQFVPETKAEDEDWVKQARTQCTEQHGYLITRVMERVGAAQGVLCVPMIFEKERP